MPNNAIDGTPDAVKVACPVWTGGKDRDNIKVLPIGIWQNTGNIKQGNASVGM